MTLHSGILAAQFPQKAYLAPFFAFFAFLAVADIVPRFADDQSHWLLAQPLYWIYPLQTVVCGLLLLRFWHHYPLQKPRRIVLSTGIGILAFLAWISPQEIFNSPPRMVGFDPEFAPPGWPSALSLGMRFLRLVVVVPLLEEIFWRGFLMRYLIQDRFLSVPFGAFHWRAFALVALFFGLAHSGPDFFPALATGVFYNIVACRTGRLGSCVLAHATTNLLLGLYIMKTGQWGFW